MHSGMIKLSIKCYVILLIILAFSTLHAFEAKNSVIKLVTPSWPQWTNEDGTGFYFDLVDLIYPPQGYKFDKKIMPFNRSKSLVASGRADLMFSLYSRSYHANVITSRYPIDISNVIVILPKEFDWRGPETLKNKRILVPRAYRYHEQLLFNVEPVEVNDSEMAMRMFLRNREQYFFTTESEMMYLIEKWQVDMTKYRLEKVFDRTLHMGFTQSVKGRKLREVFDNTMPELIRSGKIKALYEKWGHRQHVNLEVLP